MSRSHAAFGPRAVWLAAALAVAVGGLAGCGRRGGADAAATAGTMQEGHLSRPQTVEETEGTVTAEFFSETEAAPEEPEERIAVDGKIRSYLTGEMAPVEQADRRPVAVMMSNDKASLPQYGINRAGVVYEAPVEGEMNRYMALIEDYDDLERIGSVRSCRTYYTYFAREFDAIYAHYGQSTFARPYLKNVDNINGIEGVGSQAFFRAGDKKPPHNAYTSGRLLQEDIGKQGYRTGFEDGYAGHYRFALAGRPVELSGPDALDAYRFAPGYPLNKPWFEYHEDDGEYYRFQYGAAHEGDEGPIHVKNILVQFCESGWYASTEYLDINVQTSSNGYYITNGKAIPVTWRKEGEFSPTRYYDRDGNEITLNKGKTWVCIMSTRDLYKPEFYGK